MFLTALALYFLLKVPDIFALKTVFSLKLFSVVTRRQTLIACLKAFAGQVAGWQVSAK